MQIIDIYLKLCLKYLIIPRPWVRAVDLIKYRRAINKIEPELKKIKRTETTEQAKARRKRNRRALQIDYFREIVERNKRRRARNARPK